MCCYIVDVLNSRNVHSTFCDNCVLSNCLRIKIYLILTQRINPKLDDDDDDDDDDVILCLTGSAILLLIAVIVFYFLRRIVGGGDDYD